MTPRRKQAITYLVASAPALWWGFSTFEYGGHDQGMAIAVSVACSVGILFAVCGMVMLFTKKKLGVITPMKQVVVVNKGTNAETAIRLAPAKFGSNAPAQEEMFVEEHVLSADMIIKFRSLGETVKDCNAERAEIRATLTSRKISINEDGNIEVK